MNFELPGEDTIVEGLRTLDCTIFCYNDVQKFLTENIQNKKVSDRFISWLVVLRILHQRRQSWGTHLYQMVDNYYDRCKQHFSKKPQDPLGTIPLNFESLIRPDIEGGIAWFEQITKELGVSKKFINAPILRLSRIYALLVHEAQEVSYTQNLYHFGCVCFGMAATFAEKAHLPVDFAEAVAFYLTRALISIIPLLRIMNNNQKLISHFEEVDQVIRSVAPEQYKAIKANGCTSMNFGVRYEVLLFARENHHAVDLLNIWDQILGRLPQLEFIKCLTAAHIKQIKIPPDAKNVDEIIKSWKNWNTTKIIKNAIEIMDHKRSCGESFCLFFCPKLPSFAGYEVKPQYF
ncbi:hypothetical protein TRFO_07173 [Tritrichomonas foetus]|uniref:Rab-GAP TBC domain-containing protein n=1 Tax=Tritrichomonas foetus TaxID=1144522 RepID=A0A1J4JV70_9EUKA|nr:hypothetical protein TRFO_07173 [Tritrichomonas foetus]|eukprot:OHT02336.1 hypothetical protein TRFO_07173 [Tritrichomonas foetus]